MAGEISPVSFYAIWIVSNKFLPGASGGLRRQRTADLIIMAHCNSQGISSVQMLWINIYSQCFLHNQRYLLLGSSTIPTNSLLRLTGRILINLSSTSESRSHRRPLRTPKLKNNLSITPVERRLDGQIIRPVQITKRTDLIENNPELLVDIVHLPQVQYPHIHKMRPPCLIHTHNPETKQVGSGIDAEYGASLSQSCRILCTAAVSRG